ncbi:mycofactocin precursor MftA [Streptomyces sp. NPDC059467]
MNELRPAAPAEETSPDADDTALTVSLIEAEDLLEEVSIDGMCGVY